MWRSWSSAESQVSARKNEARIYVNGYRGRARRDRSGKPGQSDNWISVWAASALPSHFSATWMKCVSIAGRSTKPRFRDCCSRESSSSSRPPPRAREAQTAAAGRDADTGRPAILRHARSSPPSSWCGSPAGPLQLGAQTTGFRDLDRVVLTPLADGHELSKRFLAFEKRLPRVGVHLGLRRDCGSTFAPVGAPQTVTSEKLTRYVFEGTHAQLPRSRGGEGQRQLPRGRSRNRRPQRVHRWPRHAAPGDPLGGIRRARITTAWPPRCSQEHLRRFRPQERSAGLCAKGDPRFRHPRLPPSHHCRGRSFADGGLPAIIRRGTARSSRA